MKSGFFLAWLSAMTLLTAMCQAQPPSANRNRSRSTQDTLFRLLEMQQVRQEIKLRPLQTKMVSDLQADLAEQRRAAFASAGAPEDHPPLAPESRPDDRFERMRNVAQQLREQGEKLVFVILDSKQSERLNQLRLQDEGTLAFDRPAVRKQLAVTDEQFKKIQEIRRTSFDPSLSRTRRRQKLDQEVLALLDQKQQVKFKELQGEAFTFPLVLPAELRGLGSPQSGNRSRRPRN